MNSTKTIAAPLTPVLLLHIFHSSFLSFHIILWKNERYVITLVKLLYFFLFFDMIKMFNHFILKGEHVKMKKKLLVVSLCALMLMTTACGKSPKLANGEEVIASIEGKDFTADDLYKELKKTYGTGFLVDLIDNFIVDKEIEDNTEAEAYANGQIKYLREYYESMGYNFEDMIINNGYEDEKAFKEYIVKSYNRDKVVEKFLANELTDDEISEYYTNEIFGEITAKHILIMPDVTDSATDDEKKAAEEAAKAEAEALITRIQNGEDFSTLAKENSDDQGTASEGGELTFTKDQVVSEFWAASAALADGEFTAEPVKSTYGYHIILRVSQKEKPTLDKVIEDVKDALVSKKLTADKDLANKTWVKIRKKYNLTIEDSTLEKIYKNTIKTLED